ncbi:MULTISPECIES: phage antirepressor KilAC domain-containing protein [unclassified Campylobacter]|uniref:phage antirepressor KilAC domain-containing protein n=1 Tax=unclassified Campylobacter TaxID=2593542 RepID=UPI003D32AAD8
MSAIIEFNNLNLEVLEYEDTWSLSNKQVAEGFGVSEDAIRSQKARNEFKEGVHFYLWQNATGNAMQTFWTKKGVITLGFKLRETPQTILFRDWASNFILAHEKPPTIQNLLADPRAFAELALRYADEQDKNKQLTAKIEADMPYTDFGRVAEISKGSLLIRDFAKILCSKGLNIGEKRLYQWFRDNGYIIPSSTEPYQKYVEAGYFERKPSFVNNINFQGEKLTTRITAKGQVYFTEKIFKSFGRDVA